MDGFSWSARLYPEGYSSFRFARDSTTMLELMPNLVPRDYLELVEYPETDVAWAIADAFVPNLQNPDWTERKSCCRCKRFALDGKPYTMEEFAEWYQWPQGWERSADVGMEWQDASLEDRMRRTLKQVLTARCANGMSQ